MGETNKIKYLATWTDEELDSIMADVDSDGTFYRARVSLFAVIQLYRALRDHHVEETTELWARIRVLREAVGVGETVTVTHGSSSGDGG